MLNPPPTEGASLLLAIGVTVHKQLHALANHIFEECDISIEMVDPFVY